MGLIGIYCLTTISCEEEAISKAQEDLEDTISFESNIKPIILAKCDPCHSGNGYQTPYNQYANAKNAIDTILVRINLEESNSSFMPNGSSKLDQSELDLFSQWKLEGLIEK